MNKSAFNRGLNAQTNPKALRYYLTPEKGRVFLGGDLSQAEARVVAYLAKCKELINLFNDPTRHIHMENALVVFGHPVEKDSPEYVLAKAIIHAANYREGPYKFSVQAGIPVSVTTKLFKTYHSKRPELYKWHDEVWDTIKTVGKLTGPLGDERVFYEALSCFSVTGRMADTMWKDAIAWCVTADTEVLTKSGWKWIGQVNTTDLVATWAQPTQRISFENPTAIVRRQAESLVAIDGVAVSQLVTQDHRVPILDHGGRQRVIQASQLKPKSHLIPLCGLYSGYIHAPLKLQLLAAIQADGSMRKSRAVKGIDRPKPTSVRFGFRKQRKIDRAVWLLTSLGIKHTAKRQKDGTTRICFCWPEATKKFGPWLLEYDAESLDAFLDELKYWDGHDGIRKLYFNQDQTAHEWVAIISHLRGRHATKQNCTTELNNKQTASFKLERFPLNVSVFCLTVPNGFFVIRRKGKISITGNCPQTTVPHVMNLGILNMKARFDDSMWFHHQGHDSFLVSVPDDTVIAESDVMECFDIPLTIHGQTFRIPAELSYGWNFGDMFPWHGGRCNRGEWDDLLAASLAKKPRAEKILGGCYGVHLKSWRA